MLSVVIIAPNNDHLPRGLRPPEHGWSYLHRRCSWGGRGRRRLRTWYGGWRCRRYWRGRRRRKGWAFHEAQVELMLDLIRGPVSKVSCRYPPFATPRPGATTEMLVSRKDHRGEAYVVFARSIRKRSAFSCLTFVDAMRPMSDLLAVTSSSQRFCFDARCSSDKGIRDSSIGVVS